MKNFTLCLVALLAFLSCNSDAKTDSANLDPVEVTEEQVESLAEDLLEEELAVSEEEATVEDEVGAVANEVEVELEEVKVDEAAVKEQKRAILKEQLKESPNLGKDCESILKEYAELVEKYISGEDKDAVIKRLAEWANDPIYNKCKKDDQYKDRFYDLEEKMYADEEEEF